MESVVAQHRSLAVQSGIQLTRRDAALRPRSCSTGSGCGRSSSTSFGNAVKFTGDGEVVVETGSADDGSLRVTVTDSGPGIATEEQEADLRGVRPGRDDVGGDRASAWRSVADSPAPWAATSQSRASPVTEHLLRQPSSRLPRRSCPSPRWSRRTSRRSRRGPGDERRRRPSVAPLLQKMLRGEGYRVAASPSSIEVDRRRRQTAATAGHPARPADAGPRRSRHPAS